MPWNAIPVFFVLVLATASWTQSIEQSAAAVEPLIEAPAESSAVSAAPPPPPARPVDSGIVELDPMAVFSKAKGRGRHEKLTGTASRLDAAALERMRPMGTQEALERMPGVQGYADDGAGNSRLNIGVRGLSPRRSSRVLILEDGIPIAPALYLYPNMYYNPPAERINEIELIKGAASIQYGPQTMGGVVNYITRKPRRKPGGTVQLTGGENAYGGVYAEYGGFGTETLQPELQLLYKRGDGYREHNGFEQYNATLKLNWLAGEKDALYLKLNGDYEIADATYTGLTEYSFRTNPNFNPKADDTFEIRRYAVDLIHTRDLSDRSFQTTKIYGSAFLRDWWRENDIFVLAANYRDHVENGAPLQAVGPLDYPTADLVRVGGGMSNFGNLRKFYTLGLDEAWELGHSWGDIAATLSLGARAHWERFLDGRKVGDFPSAREENSRYYAADSTILGALQNFETMALSLYAAEEVRISKLTVKPGLRFEIFEQERVDRLRGSRLLDHAEYVLLPGLGANYELGGGVNLFGGVHRGYTPPSTSTLQLLNFGQSASGGGLDLKSEKSWNSELGVRGFFPRFSVELCAYHLYIEDLVAPATGATFRNLGKAQTYGLEAAGDFKASRILRFLPDAHLAYTWLGSEVLEGEIPASQSTGATANIAGKRLPYAPEHTLAGGLFRDFDFGLSLGIDAKFVSWVYTDYENLEITKNRGDTGPIDGYAVLGASASYRLGRFRIFANAKNLMDEVYMSSRLHSHPSGIQASQSSGILIGSRRQIQAGTSVSF